MSYNIQFLVGLKSNDIEFFDEELDAIFASGTPSYMCTYPLLLPIHRLCLSPDTHIHSHTCVCTYSAGPLQVSHVPDVSVHDLRQAQAAREAWQARGHRAACRQRCL